MATYSWSVPTGNIITGNTYIKDTDNKIQDTMDDLADFVNSSGAYTGQGLMFDYVSKASNQTITGIKTFSNGIISNVTGDITGNLTGNVTGNVTGTVSGNSGTTTKLATSRTITLSGDVTGSASFDGSANVNIASTVADDSHNHTISYITGLQTALDSKASLYSPSFTGTPSLPTGTTGITQSALDNSTKIATTAYVDSKMVLMTAQNSTSGTNIDFTGIPSWVKKITIMLNGVSTNGISCPIIQIGSGSFQTSGYNGSAMGIRSSAVSSGISLTNSSYFNLIAETQNSSELYYGVISLINFSGNIWCESANVVLNDASRGGLSSGSITLSGALDRIRITTVNGTDAFDAGQINVMYEG